MSNQHKHKGRYVRGVPQEDWDALADLVGDKARSPLVAKFIAWYLGKDGAELPERPPR